MPRYSLLDRPGGGRIEQCRRVDSQPCELGVDLSDETQIPKRERCRSHMEKLGDSRVHQVRNTIGATAFADGVAIVAAAVAPCADPWVADRNSGEFPAGVVEDVNHW